MGVGALMSVPVWRAAVAATWGRRLEPKPGEEDIREKCGLGQWWSWQARVKCQNLNEVRRLFILECGGDDDRRLVLRILNSMWQAVRSFPFLNRRVSWLKWYTVSLLHMNEFHSESMFIKSSFFFFKSNQVCLGTQLTQWSMKYCTVIVQYYTVYIHCIIAQYYAVYIHCIIAQCSVYTV